MMNDEKVPREATPMQQVCIELINEKAALVKRIGKARKDGADKVRSDLCRKLRSRLDNYDELMASEPEPFSHQGEFAIMILSQIVNDLKHAGITNKSQYKKV